jgi:two-component system sensor histidine kinase UhpB
MRSLINGFNAMQDRLQAERLASIQRSVDTLERERRRISRELHDEIGQRVTGIALQLRRLHDDAPEDLRLDVTRVQERARAVLDEIETLAWQIRPGVLDDLGLLQALEALASSLADNGAARIRTSFPRGLPHVSNEAELAMYRIAQEALTNAMRHSEATSITVEVQVRSGDLILRITDNGRGRIPDRREGPGLRGMRERALLIGARLDILENSPHGVRVELVVPVRQCVA